MDEVHGPWEPLTIDEVLALFDRAPFRWWFTGGIALELHAGTSWRTHADVDVGVRRADARSLFAHVPPLSPHVAAAGQLRHWRGEPLDLAASENNIWLARPGGPWVLDVTVGSGTDDEWVYRRDSAVRRPWIDAVLRTPAGVPYLAPELQLLFKSRSPRDKDDQDLAAVLPYLDEKRRLVLASLLPEGHPWRRVVNTTR